MHSHEASPRELVDLAERSILEVAHEDRRKDFRAIHDLLSTELDKLEQLSAEGLSVTGTPSGFEDLDRITGGFQAGNLIILAARPGMGKCLAGSSLVYDPATGGRRAIVDVVAAVERGEDVEVAAVGPDLKLRPARVSAGLRSGVQPVYRLTTRLGRRLDATANHPLLTLEGWRKVSELGIGARIAVPRRLPRPIASTSMPDHEVVLLAALIADGNLTERTPRFCSGPGSAILPVVEQAASELGLTVHDGGGGTATISAGRGGPPNPLTAILRSHGLWGLRSGEKFVPAGRVRPRRRADRSLPLGPLRLRRPRVLVRALLADRLHHHQRAARARRPAPAAAARHRRRGADAAAGGLRGDERQGARGPHHRPRGPRRVRAPRTGHRQAVRPRARDDAGRGAHGQLERRHAPGGRVGPGRRIQGRPLVGRDQRGRRAAAQPQLARPFARPFPAPARPARRGDRAAASSRPWPPRTCGGTRSPRSSTSASRRPSTSRFPASTTSSRTTSSSTTAR